MKILSFFILFISTWTFAQSKLSVLSQKLKPLTWEAEKILSSNIEASIAPLMVDNKYKIKVSLLVSAQKLANRLGIQNKTQSALELPGLDESAQFIDERSVTYEPKINDVFASITNIDATVTSEKKLLDTEQTLIIDTIKAEVNTLGIEDVKINFVEAKVPQKVNPTLVELQKTQLPENLPYIIAGSVVFAGIVLSLMLYFVVFLGLKKMETMSQSFGKNLNQALSGMSLPSTPNYANQPIKTDFKKIENSPVQKIETYDELKTKISDFLKSHYLEMKDIFQYIVLQSEVETLFVFLEALPENEVANWKNQIPEFKMKEMRQFLSEVSQSQTELESILLQSAGAFFRDLRLYSHDPELLKKQALKTKVSKLDRMSLAQLLENSDEREFGFLTQIIEPVRLSSVLTSYPHILKKFNKISIVKLNTQDLLLVQKRVEDQLNNQKESIQEELSITSFLPPEIEKEFNAKMGVSLNSWDKLNPEQKKGIIPFSHSLPIDQLTAFLAILPENLKNEVLSSLPDLKQEQIKRRGIHMNEESFRLKNAFLVQQKVSAVT